LSYTVETDAALEAVVVRHTYPMGETYLHSRDELIEMVRTTGYRKVLVVLDGPGFGTEAFMIHDHISYLAANLPVGVKLAAVLRPSDEDRQSGGFAEVVGSNRGLNLKTFEEESAATRWLKTGREA
jgi:hypothetical protein